jgi:hypothetical protein
VSAALVPELRAMVERLADALEGFINSEFETPLENRGGPGRRNEDVQAARALLNNLDRPAPAHLRLAVVPSSQLPGVLSLRPVDAEGQPSGYLKDELCDAGFEPGDLVEVMLVRRALKSEDGGAR